MTRARSRLPNRRYSETFEFEHLGQRFIVTVGFYGDGRLGEVFVNAAKTGEQMQAIARDDAIAVSLLLQYGITIDAVRHSISRLPDGSAAGQLGALLDHLARYQAMRARREFVLEPEGEPTALAGVDRPCTCIDAGIAAGAAGCDACAAAAPAPSLPPMTDAILDAILAAADMSEEQLAAQRLSFAFGNVNLANEKVTRALVDQVDAELVLRP